MGHGTERAALAGLIGKEPATVEPAFLDSLRDNPNQSFPVKLGPATFNVTLKDIVYDAPKGDPFATMKELRQHAEKNNLSIAQVILANEMSIPNRTFASTMPRCRLPRVVARRKLAWRPPWRQH